MCLRQFCEGSWEILGILHSHALFMHSIRHLEILKIFYTYFYSLYYTPKNPPIFQKYLYSLNYILIITESDVSRHLLVLDTSNSVIIKMDQREYLFLNEWVPLGSSKLLHNVTIFEYFINIHIKEMVKVACWRLYPVLKNVTC